MADDSSWDFNVLHGFANLSEMLTSSGDAAG